MGDASLVVLLVVSALLLQAKAQLMVNCDSSWDAPADIPREVEGDFDQFLKREEHEEPEETEESEETSRMTPLSMVSTMEEVPKEVKDLMTALPKVTRTSLVHQAARA